MRTHKIKLDGESLELSLCFDNLDKVEQLVGKVYQLGGKIAASELGVTDLVKIYFQMQHGVTYSQDYIIDAILKDGLSHHMEQLVGLLSIIFTGDKKSNNGKK